MKRFFAVIFVLAALFSLFACNKKPMESKEQKGTVLAKVGNAVITETDFERDLKSLPDYAQQIFEDEKGREKFLDELVKKEMLYQEAQKKGFDKTPEFTKKVEEFRKLTMVSELLEKEIMAKSKVSDQDVKEYYDKHKGDFATTSQIKASHILVKTEAEARQIEARLKKGEKFEEIAKKESVDKATGKNGGDLGFFSKGQMVPEFEKAAAGLKKGEISGPVKTSFGYHIIKMTDSKTGPVIEFERIKDLIAQRMAGEKQKEAFDKYVEDLKKSYPVEIQKEALAKIRENRDKAKTDKPAETKEVPKKEESKPGTEAKPKTH